MKAPGLFTMMRFFVFLSLACAGSTSFAMFSADYASFDLVIVDQDNKPLPSFRVYYGVRAEKNALCGGGRGHPLDFGEACTISFNPEGQYDNKHFVVTDKNGRATIPAFSSSSMALTARNPHLFVEPKVVHIPLQTPHGIYGCGTESFAAEWKKSVKGEIDEDVSQELSRKGLKITYKWENEFTLKKFYEYAAEKAAEDYAAGGDEYLRLYCTK